MRSLALLTLLSAAAFAVAAQTWESIDAAAGTGVRTWPNGARYVGGYSNGRMDGKGTLTWADGSQYVGDFWQGAMHGKGAMKFRDGAKYEGDFSDNKLSGRGLMLFPDGSRYEGDFINDARSGRGIFSAYWNGTGMGTRQEGDFLDGRLNGQGKMVNINGVATHEGGFIAGVPNGPGIRRRVPNGVYSGESLVGDFVDGKLQGWAIFNVTSPKVARLEGQATSDSFYPRATLPKNHPVGVRAPQAEALEQEVKRLSALAEQNHALATRIHTAASPQERFTLSRSVASGFAASPPQSQVQAQAQGGAAATVAATSAAQSPAAGSAAQARQSATAPVRAFQTLMVSENRVDVPKKITTQLMPDESSRTVSLCGRRFLLGGIAEDGTRSFTCNGSGQPGGGRYVDGSRTGDLEWGYAIADDGQSLKTKSYQAWGDHRFVDAQEPATLIYYRFTTGPLAGRSYGSIVGRVPGGSALYLAGNFFSP